MPIWRKMTGVVVSAVTTWQTDEAAVATVATGTTAAAASAETGLTTGTTDVAAMARGSAETATWTWEVPWEEVMAAVEDSAEATAMEGATEVEASAIEEDMEVAEEDLAMEVEALVEVAEAEVVSAAASEGVAAAGRYDHYLNFVKILLHIRGFAIFQ